MRRFTISVVLFTTLFSQGYIRDVSPFPVYVDNVEVDQSFTGGLNQPDPRFIDWNGDNVLDCFINDRDGYLQYWEGESDWGDSDIPQFTFVTKTFQDINVGTWYVFYDFDGDGDYDLLSHTPDSDNVSYWSNDNGELTLMTDELMDIEDLPVYGGQIVIPALADIDNDGVMDYFIGDISGRLAYYKGHGNAAGLPQFELITSVFEEIQIVWTPGRHGANAVEFADMDNDGDLDLIWGDFYQPGLFYLENFGTPDIPDFDHTLMVTDFPQGTGFETTGHNSARIADFDGDGDGDMVVGVLSGAYGTEYLDNLYYFRNNGTAENPDLELMTSRLLPGLDLISGSHPAISEQCSTGDLQIWVGTEQDSANPNYNGSIYNLYENGGNADFALNMNSSGEYGEIGSNLSPAFFDLLNDGANDMFIGEFNGTIIKIDQEREYPNYCIFWGPEPDFLNIDLSGRSTPSFGDVDQDGDDDLVIGDKNGIIHIYWNLGTVDSAAIDSTSYLNIDIGDNASPCVLINGKIIAGNEAGELYEITYLDSEELVAELRTDIPYIGTNLAPAALYWDEAGEPDLIFGTQAGGLQYFRYDSTAAGIGNDYIPNTFSISHPYPNPFNDKFSFSLDVDVAQSIQISLINILGHKIQDIYTGNIEKGTRKFNVKTQLTSGIYFLEARSQNTVRIRKIIFLK